MEYLWILFFLSIYGGASATSTVQPDTNLTNITVYVNPGGNASVKIDPSKVDWHANDAKFVLASWINRTEYHIKYLELTNGVPGDENCYKDIDIRFQPCCLHFNISKCGQEFCIDISGITDSLAGTYIAYLYYLGTRYIPIYVYINVRIKDAPIAAMTSSPHVPTTCPTASGRNHKTSSVHITTDPSELPSTKAPAKSKGFQSGIPLGFAPIVSLITAVFFMV